MFEKTLAEKMEVTNWNFPIQNTSNYKSLIWKYFKCKLKCKIQKLKKENSGIIEIIGRSPLEMSFLLTQFIHKEKGNFNIFWFEASSNISFYLQLFQMGLDLKFLNETHELFGNFEEILINRMKNGIWNNLPWIFVLNNYSKWVDIQKLTENHGILWIIIQDKMTQIPSKHHEYEYSNISNFSKINYVKLTTCLPKFEFSQNFESQENILRISINVPKSFIQILENFCQNSLESLKVEQSQIKKYLYDFEQKESGQIYFIKGQKLREILYNLNFFKCSLILDWIDEILNEESIAREYLPFIEILMVSMLYRTDPRVCQKMLKLIEKVGKWIKYFQNKVKIGNYFIYYCDQLSPYGSTFNEKFVYFWTKVGEIFFKIDPNVGAQICQNALAKLDAINENIETLNEVSKSTILPLNILRAKCLFKTGDVKSALQILENLKENLEEYSYEIIKGIISLKNVLAEDCIVQGTGCAKGLKIFQENFDKIRKIGCANCLEFELPFILKNYGYNCMTNGEYSKALEIFEKIQKIQIDYQDDIKSLASTLISICHLHVKLGNFAKSFEILRKIFEIYTHTGTFIPLEKIYFYFMPENSAWECNEILSKNFEKILLHYNNQMKIITPLYHFENIPKFKVKICEYLHLARIRADLLCRPDDSVKNLEKLNQLIETKIWAKLQLAEIYQWCGFCHNSQGQSEAALGYFKKGLKILEKYKKFGLELACNYYSMCEVYNNMGECDLSIEYLKKAYRGFKSSDNVEGMLILMNKAEKILGSDFNEKYRTWLVCDF